jgi:hypothetical protein
LQQDEFELRLLRRISGVAGLDGRLRLGNRDRELGKVIDALRFVERASLGVGVDGGGGDCDECADVELEQLVGMCRLERDDVDDEIEAVGDGERVWLITVERDVVEACRSRPLGLAGERDLPAVGRERVRDGGSDVAGAAENEGAGRDRSLDDHDGVADADLAVGEDVGVQSGAMDECLDHARLRHRLEMRARLTKLDPFAFDVADAEALADQLVDVDPTREDVAASSSRLDRHDAVTRNCSHRLGCDQGDSSPRRRVAVFPVVAVALETSSRAGTDPIDRSR